MSSSNYATEVSGLVTLSAGISVNRQLDLVSNCQGVWTDILGGGGGWERGIELWHPQSPGEGHPAGRVQKHEGAPLSTLLCQHSLFPTPSLPVVLTRFHGY